MKNTISRRTFLKLSGATVATVALAHQMPKGVLHAEGNPTKKGVKKLGQFVKCVPYGAQWKFP